MRVFRMICVLARIILSFRAPCAVREDQVVRIRGRKISPAHSARFTSAYDLAPDRNPMAFDAPIACGAGDPTALRVAAGSVM